MAISDQIGRLTTLRNNIRTKLIGLGILPAASTSATLSECYSVLSNVTGLGASSYTPTTTTQVIPSGRYLSGPQTINAIPSAYIIPSGTVVLSSSGTFDVTSYASADVTVTGGPSNHWLELTKISGYTYNVHLIDNKSLGSSAFSHININSITDNLSYLSYLPYGLFESANFMTSVSVLSFNSCLSVVDKVFCNANANNKLDVYFPILSSTNAVEVFRFRGSMVLSIMTSSNGAYIYLPELSVFNINLFNTVTTIALPATSTSLYNTMQEKMFDEGAATQVRSVYMPKITEIPDKGFAGCYNLMSLVVNSNLSRIGRTAFYGCERLNFSEISFSKITYIGPGAFGCANITELNIPLFSSVLESTFAPFYYSHAGWAYSEIKNYAKIESFFGEKCTGFVDTFEGCSKLKTVFSPSVSYISSKVFQNCSVLSEIDLPNLKNISANYNFQSCKALSFIGFSSLITINGSYNFSTCTQLLHFSFPNLTTISGNGNFYGCSNLFDAVFPNYSYTSVTGSMFDKCSSLSLVSFGITSRISGTYMFRGCYHLISLFFLGSSVCVLGNTIASMFGSTPVSNYSTSAGRWASIFVPQSLLASYKAATNWTTISSKIFAYESYFDANGNPL